MQNSYVTLHRTLDTTISNLESQLTPNTSLITDLKKKKLQLKEHIALGKALPKGAHSKLASMLSSHKVNEKMKRKQRKIAKHAYDEELKRRLSGLSGQFKDMKVSKETIWHFTCQSCTAWWSIAASDNWIPKKLFCPHCGKQRVHDNKLIEWVEDSGILDSFDDLPG